MEAMRTSSVEGVRAESAAQEVLQTNEDQKVGDVMTQDAETKSKEKTKSKAKEEMAGTARGERKGEGKENPDAPGTGDEVVIAEPADGTGEVLGEDWQARAEGAEALAAELGDRLGAVEAAAQDLQRMVKEAEQTRCIERELLVAGVVDLEDARALVEAQIEEGTGVMESVMRVKERKPLLFAEYGSNGGGRGVRGGRGGRGMRATLVGMREEGKERGDESIASAAEVARESGDRRMLLRYLQMRRER